MTINNVEVIEFGENISNGKNQWYKTPEGHTIKCSEDTIQSLWNQWSMSKGADKRQENNQTIYFISHESNK